MDKAVIEISEKTAGLAREFESCRQSFIALGDENRQRIVIALLEHFGGMRVGELTACTHLSRPAVSHHLKILKNAEIVNMYKKGTMNFYYIDPDGQQWRKLKLLVDHVNETVDMVFEKRSAGFSCPTNED